MRRITNKTGTFTVDHNGVLTALAHNPKRSDTKPYLSRDEKLQSILDNHRNIIFISGHTHISMESPVSCVEHDEPRNNIYINDGSIRPTTKLTRDGKPEAEPAEGNVVELLIDENQITVTVISTKTGLRHDNPPERAAQLPRPETPGGAW